MGGGGGGGEDDDNEESDDSEESDDNGVLNSAAGISSASGRSSGVITLGLVADEELDDPESLFSCAAPQVHTLGSSLPQVLWNHCG